MTDGGHKRMAVYYERSPGSLLILSCFEHSDHVSCDPVLNLCKEIKYFWSCTLTQKVMKSYNLNILPEQSNDKIKLHVSLLH